MEVQFVELESKGQSPVNVPVGVEVSDKTVVVVEVVVVVVVVVVVGVPSSVDDSGKVVVVEGDVPFSIILSEML